MNAESERTKEWMKKHPERAKINQANAKKRKMTSLTEALRLQKKSSFKTPMQAIKGYCRRWCQFGESRADFPNALVTCSKKRCPFYPYRNGDPTQIKRGMNNKNGVRAIRMNRANAAFLESYEQ